MKHNAVFSALCTMLVVLFALTTFTPTDAIGAVSKNTAKKEYSSKSVSKKKHRKHRSRRSKCSAASRARGKQQALDLVRTQSESLCKMTGLDYVSTEDALATAQETIQTDGEEGTAMDQGTAALHGEIEGEILSELEAEDDVPVDIENFRSLWLSYVDDEGDELTEAGIERQKIVDVIMDWLGTRYKFGGTTRGGIDCSAFTGQLYRTAGNIEIPRTASEQSTIGQPVHGRANLKFGDLIFFHTRRHARVSHVGIYLGDNLFAHSSSRYGVTISSLESTYYGKRFLGGSRITESDLASHGNTTRTLQSE